MHKHPRYKRKTTLCSVMEAPQVKSLASAGLFHNQKSSPEHLLLTRSFHSTDCHADHSMVISRVHLQSAKVDQTKQPRWLCINSAKTADPELCAQFVDSFEWTLLANQTQAVSGQDRWSFIWDTIHNIAMASFGRKGRSNQDWFEANLSKLEPVIKV